MVNDVDTKALRQQNGHYHYLLLCHHSQAPRIVTRKLLMLSKTVFSEDKERPMLSAARLGMKGNARVPLGKMKSGKKDVVGLVVFDTAVAVDVDEEVTFTETDGDDDEVSVK